MNIVSWRCHVSSRTRSIINGGCNGNDAAGTRSVTKQLWSEWGGPTDPDASGSRHPHGIHHIYFPFVVCLIRIFSFSLARFSVHPDSASVHMPSSISSFDQDPLTLYSKTLHDYTLHLWTESRRVAEEKAKRKLARMEEETTPRNLPTTQRPHSP